MKYILPTIILLFAALSCKKVDNGCNGKYTATDISISSYFNSYQFKEGTYWVYQNDATTEIDSQRVVSATLGQIGSGGGSSCGSTYADLYTITVHSFLNNESFNYHILTTSFIKNPNATSTPDGTPILTSSDIENTTPIPSMTINGNTFSNVRKVPVGNVYYYFVDSIGIVKWEELDGATVLESWSIQSWDVVL